MIQFLNEEVRLDISFSKSIYTTMQLRYNKLNRPVHEKLLTLDES